MVERTSLRARLVRFWGSIPFPSLRSRAVFVLAPVHILAFVALYLATLHIVEKEILQTHSQNARLLMREALRDLQPVMCSPDRAAIPAEVARFARAHAVFNLRIYRADATSLTGGTAEDPQIARFLAGPGEDRFDFATAEGLTLLQGIVRIRARDACVQCHREGEALGAATMALDLTPQITVAERHLQGNLVVLIVTWALAVGLVNIGLAYWTRRSLTRLHGDLPNPAEARHAAEARMPPALLDPVAAEIYASLSRLIHQRARQENAVSDKLHRTDRLASLGQLAAGLAHEIKNPLAGIRGVMELLRDDATEGEKRELYEQIVGELDRVNGTIHSLLNFARPTLPRRAPTDVAELLDDSLRLLRPSLAQRSIDLRVEVAKDVGMFGLDAAQIRQVLTNLVTNAADAIEQNGIILVRASRFPTGDGVIISVQDDGPGISEEVRAELFEPFFTTKFSGTGLGLAVVKSLVQQHGGRVEVQSEVGRGSTFFVLLPERAEPAHDGPVPGAAEG